MDCQLPNSLSHHPTFLNNRPSCIEDGGSGHFSFSTLASVGPAGVEAAKIRGDDMDEVSMVIEMVLTVTQLEWQVKKNKAILRKAGARL